MPECSRSAVSISIVMGLSCALAIGCSGYSPIEEGEDGQAQPEDPSDDPAATDPDAQGELPLGDMTEEDLKADGNWGAATTCKAIPDLPQLRDPQITV